MIKTMNPCSEDLEAGGKCGGQDFSFSHKIEGNLGEEVMIVSIRCNCCTCIKEHSVNILNAVSKHIETCKCANKIEGNLCNASLTIDGTTTIRGSVQGEEEMILGTKCTVCNDKDIRQIKIRDVVNLETVGPHNTDNPV
jgi:hypothetical protein